MISSYSTRPGAFLLSGGERTADAPVFRSGGKPVPGRDGVFFTNALDKLGEINYNSTGISRDKLHRRSRIGREGGGRMIPLSYANPGEEAVIRRIGGSPEVKKHLENLGFVVGGTVTVISSLNGNLIVKVKETRVGLDEAMARRIMI